MKRVIVATVAAVAAVAVTIMLWWFSVQPMSPANLGTRPLFLPSTTYVGTQEGYVFTTRSGGTGYYYYD